MPATTRTTPAHRHPRADLPPGPRRRRPAGPALHDRRHTGATEVARTGDALIAQRLDTAAPAPCSRCCAPCPHDYAVGRVEGIRARPLAIITSCTRGPARRVTP